MRNYSTRGLTGLLGDVRKTNNFRLIIDEVTEDNDLDLIIQRAFLPKVSINPLELRHGNDAKKLAGNVTWQGGQITVLDVLSRKELDTLLDWFYKTYDADTGAIGIASEYKRDGTIIEYASDGRFVRRWNVKGLWITDLDLGQLDMSASNLKELQFTLSIDPSPLRPEYEDSKEPTYQTE